VLVDLRGEGTQLHPFAASDIVAGAVLADDTVEWRKVPRGLMPVPGLDGKVASHALQRGDPITPSALADHRSPPVDWWSVELPLPEGTTAGLRARVVVDDPPLAIDAVIVSVADGGAFDRSTNGLVAVPAEVADAIARAATRGNALVLIAP
jgi:hypothetical protein